MTTPLNICAHCGKEYREHYGAQLTCSSPISKDMRYAGLRFRPVGKPEEAMIENSYDYIVASGKLAARDAERQKPKMHIVQIRDYGGKVRYAIYPNRNAVRMLGFANSLQELKDHWVYLTRTPK